MEITNILSHSVVMTLLMVLSIVTLIGGVGVLPMVILRLPVDYFVTQSPAPSTPPHSFLWRIARNILGTLMIALGVLLIFLPGQGVLTMIAGLLVCDFPGKKRLLITLIQQSKLAPRLNAYRSKRGVPPLTGI